MVCGPRLRTVMLLLILSATVLLVTPSQAWHGEWACSDYKPAGANEHDTAYCNITFEPCRPTCPYDRIHVRVTLEETIGPLDDVRVIGWINEFEDICVGDGVCEASRPWPDWGSSGGGYPGHQWCAGFAVRSSFFSGHEDVTQIPFGYLLECWAE